jgi:two-component system chemotaxis sensor kinase CheA
MASLADDNLISDFVAESREHLNSIEPDLLEMEQKGAACSQDVINRVFRAIHSIKGGAGFFAFESLKTLSHIMESVLMLVRDKTLVVSPALMDPLFAGLDRLRAMLDDIQASDGVPIQQEVARLKAILEGGGAEGGTVEASVQGGTGRRFNLDSDAVRSVLKRGMILYHAKAYLHRDVDAKWKSPLAFLSGALSVGQCLDAFLDVSDIGGLEDETEADLCVTLLFASVLEPDLLLVGLKLPESQIETLDMTALKASLLPKPAAAPASTAPPEKRAAKPPAIETAGLEEGLPEAGSPEAVQSKASKEAGADTLRVKVGLLSKLMNLTGELVLGRNQLLRTMGPHALAFPGLAAILQNINQVTTELQEAAVQTRMQPIGGLFSRFPRIVRDMAKALGKQIDVEIKGAEVELDKSIVELLSDPLTHIIRNCADHALETPAERKAARKKPAGLISLHAFHEGGQVNIVVHDDGRGIDAAKIAQKAIQKGLITKAQADSYSEQELVNLIFAPGFSMAEKVSEISGRGVGMDVVRTNVEKLGGQVEIDTALGFGTTVRLRLPLTLAIMPAMIVGTEDQRFAIPQVDVLELVWVQAEDAGKRIERVQGAEVLRLRDKLLPLVRLSSILEMERTFVHPETKERKPDLRQALADRRSGQAEREERGKGRREDWRSDYNVVVLQLGASQFGIIVDELHDFEEIVVKPLSNYLEGPACFSGSTILGDGRVIMILDCSGIAARARLRFLDLKAEERKRQEEEQQRLSVLASKRSSVILFEAGGTERFAIPQDQVLRLEKIQGSAIEHVGAR